MMQVNTAQAATRQTVYARGQFTANPRPSASRRPVEHVMVGDPAPSELSFQPVGPSQLQRRRAELRGLLRTSCTGSTGRATTGCSSISSATPGI